MFREKNKDAFFDILRDFEGKKKSIKPESENKITFTIPTSLNHAYKEVTGKDLNIDMFANQDRMKNITFTSNKLRFHAIQIKAFFTQTCDEIAEHVKSIFRLPQLHGVENVLMVGGFSESPMLQDAVKKSLGRQKKVFIPLDAGLAVLKGAVIYGHHPSAIISRVSKNTYGIEMHTNFVQGEHDEHRKIIIDGAEKCKGVFDKHVEIGQEVKEGTVFGEHSYVPLRRNSTSIYLKVFTTKHKNPQYIDGCQYLGGLEVDLDDPEIKCYEDKEVLVKMIYGGTELGLEATIVKTGEKINARFNFLG